MSGPTLFIELLRQWIPDYIKWISPSIFVFAAQNMPHMNVFNFDINSGIRWA